MTGPQEGAVAWIDLFLDIPRADFEDGLAFWMSATGWTPSPRRGEQDQFVTLLSASGDSWLKLQAVDGPAGVHLDLDTHARAAATARALELGATPAWTYHDVEVQRSPGGFTFCQTVGTSARFVDRSESAIVDQLCLDIPPALWETEVAFWAALTGRTRATGSRAEFAVLGRTGQLRLLLQRLDDASGPVRGHPDLAASDRAAAVVQHRELGADVIREHERWTVMRSPYGQVYCLTDRNPATGTLGT